MAWAIRSSCVMVDDEVSWWPAGHGRRRVRRSARIPDFPAGTNVEFVRRVAEDLIEIRIYERGVGPTSSSGTGTSASAAAMIALEGAPARLRVLAPGGEQVVEWPDRSAELQLTGPAVVLARGQWLAGERC